MMKFFLNFKLYVIRNKLAILILLTVTYLTAAPSQVAAQTPVNETPLVRQPLPSSQNVSVLLNDNFPSAKVIKREVIPGFVKLTSNGCVVQNPILTTFLDDGTTLITPAGITIFGNSLSQWRNEYKQPWRSKLTDYEGGEYKITLLQIGKHPPTLIRTEESDKKLIDAQTSCNIAIHKVYRSNLRLIKPIQNPEKNNFSLSFSQGWEKHFTR